MQSATEIKIQRNFYIIFSTTFSGLKKNNAIQLHVNSFSVNNISDEGGKALAEALKSNHTLKHLNIHGVLLSIQSILNIGCNTISFCC